MSRVSSSVWSLAFYTLLSLAFFGPPVLPFLGHPSTTVIARDQIDSSLFMWFFAWWPHALLHGTNPFVTHAMFVPEGFNLQWTTPMPGPSIVLAPITLAFGPAVTYNLIQLLSPALSAWAAFALCRHVTGKTWPSVVGGYAFGFSPYVLAHLTGSPFLALVPLVPVFVLLVLRRLDGSITARRFVSLMALAMIAQFLVSTEVLATAALFGAFALIIAYALFAGLRRPLIEVVRLIVAAGIATAVVVSPFLYFFFFGRHYPPIGTAFSADLLSFVKPPGFLETSPGHAPTGLVLGSGEAYLGAPLLVLIAAFLWERRSERVARLAVAGVVVALVASLGRLLHVNGQPSVALPWHLLAQLPVLRYAIPIRFALFAILPAALVLAIWLADRGGPVRWGLALLTIASFAPNLGNVAWQTKLTEPAFFARGTYRRYLTPADRVVTIPTLGANERWQALSGFRFALASGYAGAYPPSYARFPTWGTLLTGALTPDYAAQLRRFVAAKGVTAVVVDKRYPGPWRRLFATLGTPPLDTGGVLLYRIRSAQGARVTVSPARRAGAPAGAVTRWARLSRTSGA